MTDRQSHEYLENKQRMMTQNRFAFTTIEVEANAQAILALERQIKRKPKIEIWTGGIVASYYCNKCYLYFGDRVVGDAILFHTPYFCECCGQAIDWSE